jgi:hypothetical protein
MAGAMECVENLNPDAFRVCGDPVVTVSVGAPGPCLIAARIDDARDAFSEVSRMPGSGIGGCSWTHRSRGSGG